MIKNTAKRSFLGISKKPIELSLVIDVFIFLYVTSIYILSYSQTMNIFSKMLAFALMALLAVYMISKKTIKFSGMIVYFALFTLFCLLSCLWAIDVSVAISKVSTLTQIFVLTFLLYNYLQKEGKIEFLISVVCIAGTIFAVYTVLYFGVEEYFNGLEEGIRMGTEITNVNTIGLVTASAAIIAIWNVIYNRSVAHMFFTVVCTIVALGSGSRKALVLLILGIIMLIVLKNGSQKMFKGIVQAMSALVLVFLVLQLPMFETVGDRMESFFNVFTGDGDLDGSTRTRLAMIDAGWKQFTETPFTGVGIGNSNQIAMEALGKNTYLHNNYIELLASIGLFGTLLYYMMYITPAVSLIKPALKQNRFAILALSLLMIELVLQYGVVQYYEKTPYLYILLFSLIADKERVKKNAS